MKQTILKGMTIIITRPEKQSDSLRKPLLELGATVLSCPTISIEPPPDEQSLKAALADIHTYDWLIFTSVNGVQFFTQYIEDMTAFRSLLGQQNKPKIAVIGPATAQALAKMDVTVSLIPEKFVAEALVDMFRQKYDTLQGMHFLLPRADRARSLLSDELRKLGAAVTDVVAYCTRPAAHFPAACRQLIQQHKVDLFIFTSSSTVEDFFELLDNEEIYLQKSKLKAISIGPITSRTLRSFGISPYIEARDYTVPGLLDAIIERYQP
ncbi:uroporphyrinogen-III synthase [candidate division CSSED10-310 bacterium]|uniref:Uroporphyrinogen-III synthase n=1 Tax=candidate division CSSED10-310 bacterium TaxID=2855610 RepID=A0ABV6Z3J8_UNCC1